MTLATQTALLALLERIASALERAHPLPDPPVRLANTPDAAPEPDADGWIEWPGGSGVCPIPSDWTITARLRSDVIVTRPAKAFRWHHLNWASDLVAFRITQAVPPEPASEPDADGWVATDAWWARASAALPLGVLPRLINYLEPLVERFVAKQDGGAEDTAVVDFVRGHTVVGILPVPHPIMTRKYQPNAYTASWFVSCFARRARAARPRRASPRRALCPDSHRASRVRPPLARVTQTTFIWSTIFLSFMGTLPLFDANQLRMFSIATEEGEE